jgi:hypothetical protein
MRKRLFLTLLCLALPATPPVHGQEVATDSAVLCRSIDGSETVQAELLFGRNIEGRRNVSDAEWAEFLGREVTPRFPDGLTVFEAAGQWRDGGTGLIMREPSYIVMILAPGTGETLAHLSAIRTAYVNRFHQQSVGLTLSQTCVDF